MSAARATSGLVPLLMVALAGCDAGDVVAPHAVDRATVRIAGPSDIIDAGTYTWVAILDPDNDATDEDIQWEASWIDSDAPARRHNGRSFSLAVDPRRGRIELKLTVAASGRTSTAGMVVNSCAAARFDDNALIPQCDERLH